MDEVPRSPVVARRRLGTELRQLRELAGVSVQEAAAKIDASQSTISRLETGEGTPRTLEVRELVNLYNAPDSDMNRLLDLVAIGRRPSWFDDYKDVLPTGSVLKTYIGLEDEASEILSFSNGWIPGLLQTEAYARAVFETMTPERSPSTIDRLIKFRLRRREVLTRDDEPAHLIAMIDESAIVRACGGREVMAEQLRDLRGIVVEGRPNVTVELLPFSAGLNAILKGDATVLRFASGRTQDTVFIEGPQKGQFEKRPDVVLKYVQQFRSAQASVLRGDALIDRLDQALEDLT